MTNIIIFMMLFYLFVENTIDASESATFEKQHFNIIDDNIFKCWGCCSE